MCTMCVGFQYLLFCSNSSPQEYGPYLWDIAAGSLIVEEAGGVVVHPTGSKFDPRSRGVLATNQKFWKKLKFPPY